MKQFNSKEQENFWSGYDDVFAGDSVSGLVVKMSAPYIGGSAIDVGAANGSLIKAFRVKYKDRKKITGIDISPKSDLVQKGDSTNLDFPDKTFDTYFSTAVIEHLNDEDLDKYLSEANRILQTNGHAVFTTLNNENLKGQIVTCPECESSFHTWGHCQSFDEERIKKLLTEKGFSIIKFRKLHLDILAQMGVLAKIFYFLQLEKIIKYDSFVRDFFIVVKKEKDLS